MSENVVLELTDMAATGEAIGRDKGGRVVFVADALPGERVEVEIVAEHKRWRRARLLHVLATSPDRVTPPCPYFGPPDPVSLPDGSRLDPGGAARCAGCRWQHIDYERQLALKRRIVVDVLTNLAQLGSTPQKSRQRAEALVAEVIALGAPEAENAVLEYAYRIQIRFALDDRGRLCLPGRTDAPAPIDYCLLHHPQLAELFAAFHVAEDTGRALAREIDRVTMAVGGAAETLVDGHEGVLVLHTRQGEAPDLDLDVPVNVFLFDETVGALDLLVGDWGYGVALGHRCITAYPPVSGRTLVWPHVVGNEALAAITADVIELQPYEHLLDLWAGAGVLAAGLAEQAATVIAVDEDEMAVAALQANLAEFDNTDIHQGEIIKTVRRLRRGRYKIDVALLTPPGGTLDPELFMVLYKMWVSRCAVITENLATLARSLAAIAENGYELTSVQPVDLHPQQPNVTLIARFDRRD